MTVTDVRGRRPTASTARWFAEVRELARRRDAVLLAHNYQLPEIQDVADHTGDSLALSRIAAESSRVDDRVLRRALHGRDGQDPRPGQDGADPGRARPAARSPTRSPPTQLRAWKAEHPGAVVVSYVNTTAAVKAETDICCTSSNAVEVVASIPADREVLFLPDQFLGAHVRRITGRREHARLGGGVPRARRASTAPSSPRKAAGAPRRRAVRAPRVRLRDLGALPGRRRRGARRPGQDPLDRRDARRRPRRRTRRRCWSPPRSACCTSCAGPPRRSTSAR